MMSGNGHVNGDEANGLSEGKRHQGRLVDETLACRYLAAQCLVRLLCCRMIQAV